MEGPLECIGALDQGTQSTRFFLFDKDCQPIASHQVNLPQIYPEAGWCEQDPQDIWRTVQEAMAGAHEAALEKAGARGLKVLALGITNQRETTVVWSRSTGLPLHNAIAWLDNRTSELCEDLAERHGGHDAFRGVAGLPISPYFSATKLLWMVENSPQVKAAMESGDAAVGTVDSWLIYQLTGGLQGGVHVTDVSNASRTLLMDLSKCEWSDRLLEAFRCPRACLPRIVSNAEVYGSVVSGPLQGVPIAGCLGDQMAAVLGQRCRPGEAKNTYGTGCFMLLNTGPKMVPSTHGLLTTVSFKLGPQQPTQYALEGSVAVAGLGISWLRDNMGLIDSAEDSERLAGTVNDTGGVYFVPAFSGLLAPRWRPDARGVLLGMTAFTTKAHVVRALLEAICFQTREVLDAMRRDVHCSSMDGSVQAAAMGSSLLDLLALRVDGGAAANGLLMQLQADILQVPVLRPTFRETTGLGAALAAGLGIGFWSPDQVFAGHPETVMAFRPGISALEATARYSRWHMAVERSLGLADLEAEWHYHTPLHSSGSAASFARMQLQGGAGAGAGGGGGGAAGGSGGGGAAHRPSPLGRPSPAPSPAPSVEVPSSAPSVKGEAVEDHPLLQQLEGDGLADGARLEPAGTE